MYQCDDVFVVLQSPETVKEAYSVGVHPEGVSAGLLQSDVARQTQVGCMCVCVRFLCKVVV